jgi:hypothetical protein
MNPRPKRKPKKRAETHAPGAALTVPEIPPVKPGTTWPAPWPPVIHGRRDQ